MDKISQPLRVLIVEDNPNDAELVLRELRRAGFDPDWKRVDTEAEFSSSLGPEFDIILSDYAMPQFDGLRALQLLRESRLDIPFILVSATIGEKPRWRRALRCDGLSVERTGWRASGRRSNMPWRRNGFGTSASKRPGTIARADANHQPGAGTRSLFVTTRIGGSTFWNFGAEALCGWARVKPSGRSAVS